MCFCLCLRRYWCLLLVCCILYFVVIYICLGLSSLLLVSSILFFIMHCSSSAVEFIVYSLVIELKAVAAFSRYVILVPSSHLLFECVFLGGFLRFRLTSAINVLWWLPQPIQSSRSILRFFTFPLPVHSGYGSLYGRQGYHGYRRRGDVFVITKLFSAQISSSNSSHSIVSPKPYPPATTDQWSMSLMLPILALKSPIMRTTFLFGHLLMVYWDHYKTSQFRLVWMTKRRLEQARRSFTNITKVLSSRYISISLRIRLLHPLL